MTVRWMDGGAAETASSMIAVPQDEAPNGLVGRADRSDSWACVGGGGRSCWLDGALCTGARWDEVALPRIKMKKEDAIGGPWRMELVTKDSGGGVVYDAATASGAVPVETHPASTAAPRGRRRRGRQTAASRAPLSRQAAGHGSTNDTWTRPDGVRFRGRRCEKGSQLLKQHGGREDAGGRGRARNVCGVHTTSSTTGFSYPKAIKTVISVLGYRITYKIPTIPIPYSGSTSSTTRTSSHPPSTPTISSSILCPTNSNSTIDGHVKGTFPYTIRTNR
ncbi:hypothetical protein DFJ73DRAFT_784431 [Zopfochytrium polystomum]|nr:hypothetical protein DFJ73DRAFT_784431 [Zopfochytrium polystomum]